MSITATSRRSMNSIPTKSKESKRMRSESRKRQCGLSSNNSPSSLNSKPRGWSKSRSCKRPSRGTSSSSNSLVKSKNRARKTSLARRRKSNDTTLSYLKTIRRMHRKEPKKTSPLSSLIFKNRTSALKTKQQSKMKSLPTLRTKTRR